MTIDDKTLDEWEAAASEWRCTPDVVLRLIAEVRRLREALEPFARHGSAFFNRHDLTCFDDDGKAITPADVPDTEDDEDFHNVGDLRRAARVYYGDAEDHSGY